MLCETAQTARPINRMVQPEAQAVAHTCNHCEDFENPVTPENGISLAYPVDASGLQIDLYLHHECAEAWSRDFDIPLSSHAKAFGQ
jgi:hypothetical protein